MKDKQAIIDKAKKAIYKKYPLAFADSETGVMYHGVAEETYVRGATPEEGKIIVWFEQLIEDILPESMDLALEEEGKTWYFEGDELVIKRGKWVIDRYKRHSETDKFKEEK